MNSHVEWYRGLSHAPYERKLHCRFINITFCIILFIFVITFCDGLTSNDDLASGKNEIVRHRRDLIDDNVQDYLMKYGYLPLSDKETGNLRTEKQLRSAIRVMQRFGHVPQTGRLDTATRALMKRPRCALPDVLPGDARFDSMNIIRRAKRFIKQGSRWKRTNLTWGVRSFPEGNRRSNLSRWQIKREFRLATEVWARVSTLTFTELDDNPEDSDIIIEFKGSYHGDGYPFDGPGRTLAHAFYPGDGVGGDVHFDIDEPWVQHADANRTYEDISLFITAAHELGHALGLHHSDVEGALMSPYLLSFPQDFHLPDDDIRGIQEIYGAPRNWVPPSMPPPTATPPPRRTPSATRPPLGPSEKPDTCDTSYDAISVIRREIYVFRGKFFWRVDGIGKLRRNYPTEIVRFWQMLPPNLTHIDAVYERPHDGKIVFFIGPRYYVCSGNNELVETDLLRRFGLPRDLPKLDAAFIWGHNGRTYFFSDTMYWRFEEDKMHVELDYPRDMVMWRGVPYNIDSAFKFNGTTFFFKDRQFFEFDDLRMKISKRSPLLSAPFWFNCPNNFQNPYYVSTENGDSQGLVGSGLKVTSLFYKQSTCLVVLVILKIQRIFI